jgi:transcription elongation factor GreA
MSVSYFTQEGIDKIKAELHELRTKGRAEMAKAIAEARDKGDLSENAEYDAAKEAQGLHEMRITELGNLIASARVIDATTLDLSKVQPLTTVRMKNLGNNAEMTYKLVSEKEADIKAKKISMTSPIGKGLLGKMVGEIAEVQTPNGTVKFEVLEISL